MVAAARRSAHDPPSVLLTDADTRGILATARTLAAAGFAVGAVAEAPRAATHWSRSCRERFVAPDPRASPGAFIEALARIAESRRYTILIPGSDAALSAISRSREVLPATTRLGLPPEAAVEATLDKRRVGEAAHAVGLGPPRTASCATLDEAVEAAESFGYPVILKPRSTVFAAGGGFLQRSSRIAVDEQQLRRLAPDYGSPCLVQEHVAGRPYSFAGVLTDDGLAAVAMARYDRTWPPTAGNAAFATTVQPPSWLSDATRRLLDALGWRGLFELEFIGPGDGTFFPIDLNPRPYGSLALASAAGAPLAVVWCRLLLGDRPEPLRARPGCRYRWEDAELRHLLWTVRHVGARAAVRSLRPRRRTVHAYFRWSDPAPLVARALELGSRLAAIEPPGRSGERIPANSSPAKGRRDGPLACVMGTLDLVRPLGLAGIRCAAVASAGHPVHYSRFVDVRIDRDQPALDDRLIQLARSQTDPPVLFYESDDDLEFIAERRERLERSFRFLLPPTELLRGLLDKERFLGLARRLDLPVPRAEVLTPQAADAPPAELADVFPLVLKPLPYRDHEWYTHISSSKVLRVDSPETLRALWPRLRATRLQFLAQELVAGPETRIESYHVFVDAQGRIAGEFAGRKVRTFPQEFGRSTALETTDERDVIATGRDIVERLELTGVAKLDFKRDARGRLYLLEVNPRYSLWMHLGALAGVNLAAIAYADLTGSPRPEPTAARPGVRWCWPLPDAKAAREHGASWWSWLRWAVRADARTNLFLDDPMPFLRGWLWPRLPGVRGRGTAGA